MYHFLYKLISQSFAIIGPLVAPPTLGNQQLKSILVKADAKGR